MTTQLNTEECSLTAPEDRDRVNKWKPQQGAPPLTESEVEAAMEELNVTSFVEKFPRVDRTYADPPIALQNFALVSFVPAKGATPNERGVFGFAKVRGSYGTQLEADQRAEHLIRNVDSYNTIFHTYVGRPFPITLSSNYSADTKEIDIRKDITQTISGNIKKQRDEDAKTIREMKEKEQALLEESERAKADDGTGAPPETDPYEEYITQCVKKAQLSWTFMEHIRKLHEVANIIRKTRAVIAEMDEEHPEFAEKYFEKYQKARKDAGLETDPEKLQNNFINFMVEDIPLPTIDTDEVLPELPKSKSETDDDTPTED